MNTFAVLIYGVALVSVVVADAEEFDDRHEPGDRRFWEFRHECLEEWNITKDNAKEFFTDKTDEGQRKKSCFKACFFERLGVLNGNTLDADKIAEMFSRRAPRPLPDDFYATIDECVNQSKVTEDKCEVVQEFRKCFRNKLPMHFMRPMHLMHRGGMHHKRRMPMNEDDVQNLDHGDESM